MISLFEEAEPQAKVAEVVPLEFASLDDPEPQPLEALRTELEAGWSRRVKELEDLLVSQQRSAQLALDAARHEADGDQIRVKEEAEQRIAEVRRQVAETLARFAGERERYFAEVEREVVHLALAIAERVLHREVAMDPVLLRAAVRVALERVEGEGKVTLRVAADSKAMWSSALDAEMRSGAVELVGDEHIPDDGAVLETSVGRVDLGVREQLKEIELGFFDLMGKRPER